MVNRIAVSTVLLLASSAPAVEVGGDDVARWQSDVVQAIALDSHKGTLAIAGAILGTTAPVADATVEVSAARVQVLLEIRNAAKQIREQQRREAVRQRVRAAWRDGLFASRAEARAYLNAALEEQ